MKFIGCILLLFLSGCTTPSNVWKWQSFTIEGENGESRYVNNKGEILIKTYHSQGGMTKDIFIYRPTDGCIVYPVPKTVFPKSKK